MTNVEKEKKARSIIRRLKIIDKDLSLINCGLRFTGTQRNNAIVVENDFLKNNMILDMDGDIDEDYCIGTELSMINVSG